MFLCSGWRRRSAGRIVDLHKLTVPTEARNKISTKVAFQYSILPAAVNDGTLQVVVERSV